MKKNKEDITLFKTKVVITDDMYNVYITMNNIGIIIYMSDDDFTNMYETIGVLSCLPVLMAKDIKTIGSKVRKSKYMINILKSIKGMTIPPDIDEWDKSGTFLTDYYFKDKRYKLFFIKLSIY